MIVGNGKRNSFISILGIFVLVAGLVLAGGVACQKKAAEEAASSEGTMAVKEGLNDFEGTVKVVYGKYFYVPEIQGFDVLVPGMADSATLEGKVVKIQGEFKREIPSLIVVTRIDLKEGNQFKTVFTKSAEPDLADYVDLAHRAEYQALKIEALNKSDAWEGKGKGKVFGKLEKQTVTEAGAAKDVLRIALSDAKGKLLGKIIVDNVSEFGQYYIAKLRLFDSFWFYLNIKDSIDLKTRTKTKDLFHADVVFVGLF